MTFISRIIECDKAQGTIVEVHENFRHSLWKLQDHFCNTWKVVENTNFWKKNANFPAKTDFGIFFSEYRVS